MMKTFYIASVAFALCCAVAAQQPVAEEYPTHPDSVSHAGVPQGSIQKFTYTNSRVFPGTVRDYWIYVPVQYDPDRSACVYVNQDGIQHNAPTVFDNLIARKEMPVTIGVFVNPGRVDPLGTNALARFNRSYEYDTVGPDYTRFLLDELLPDVETRTTPDGKPIKLSKRGEDRCIGGLSSGAVCAFTAAWERPDAFSRVFSGIGTYVGLRGGDEYPTLIRKFEPKPIRVFLQDGSRDLNIYAGDWWMANLTMERALVFSGYQVEHVWGEGGHNGKQSAAVFPDAMRFLWKDWPEPVRAGQSSSSFLQEILIPGENWELVSEGYKSTEGPAVNERGEVFFNDIGAGKTFKISLDGSIATFLSDSKGGDGQAFGPGGRLYSVTGKAQTITAYDSQGKGTVIAEGFRGNDLVVRHDGSVYVTESGWDGVLPSKIWLITPDQKKRVVDTGLKFANGITLSPDQSLLFVDDYKSRWVYSYQIQPDGTLNYKQRYFHLHKPETSDDAGCDGMRCDSDGRLYVATRMGVQVCDQAGRVECILPTPNGRIANLCFGGEKFDTLYAACGDKLFRRKVKVRGANPFLKPIKPAAPRL